MKQFTGKDSAFEEPSRPDLIIDTETLSEDDALKQLFSAVLAMIDQKSGDSSL